MASKHGRVRIGLTGLPVMENDEMRSSEHAMTRASLLSLRALLFRGLFVAIGPAVGLAIDGYGQHGVLLASGAVMVALALAGTLWLARTPAPDDVPQQV